MARSAFVHAVEAFGEAIQMSLGNPNAVVTYSYLYVIIA